MQERKVRQHVRSCVQEGFEKKQVSTENGRAKERKRRSSRELKC
jgi:hypothetical protein